MGAGAANLAARHPNQRSLACRLTRRLKSRQAHSPLQQRYRTNIVIPFAGGDSIASILGTTPTGYNSAIGGAWLARLAQNDSIKLILTKAAPGSGSNVNQPIRLIEARARIGTTVEAADVMPYRIRNVTVTGGTARAAAQPSDV